MSGNRETCPRCGKLATMAEGIFNFTNDTIEVISASKSTVEKLTQYRRLIEDLRTGTVSHSEVVSSIRNNAPELSKLIDLLPKTRNELYAFLTLLITILGMYIANDKEPINTNTVINSYNTTINVTAPKETMSHGSLKDTSAVSKKTQRNDKCPCGSNLKFKKCHGK